MATWNKPVGIIGTGSYVPERILTNADLEKIVDTSDAWIRERTGIEERRIAPEGVGTSFLATEAAKKALAAANTTAEELDLIIVATLTPDKMIPSTACIVQANLGAMNAAAFDIEAACSGFVMATITAANYVAMGMYKKVLVIGGEVLSGILNWNDRNTCVLFGDGAGAAVIGEVEEGYGFLGFDMGADGTGGKFLQVPIGGSETRLTAENIDDSERFVHMDGKEVYKFAVKVMGNTAVHALERANLTIDDIDYFVPHQANIRIIESAAKRLKLPNEKVFVNLPKYGNTSAASVPLALDEAVRGGHIHKGDTVVLAGFGAGLTWAGLVMKWY